MDFTFVICFKGVGTEWEAGGQTEDRNEASTV